MKWSPERTQAWTLALFPAAVLVFSSFLIFAHQDITVDKISLLIALLTGGALQVTITKREKRGQSDSNGNNRSDIRSSGKDELAQNDRSGPNYFNRRFHAPRSIWSR